ncbi:COX15/CtaA family protein [Ornithinicoccus halotolerans]|uniref:COX15/CtaA family protein n=1 Tax=Ornithinicoccus halotolerans TaxID=1748220 RepID=UPI0012979DE9|nr:COX15/CtaA family protein [Ornithinicoccus halotolerans]
MTAASAARPWLGRVLLLNLVLQSLIVLSGGLVRLTGSGLGCPTWPQCEPGSYTPTFEASAGIHPYIEFGNRMVGVVVGLVAVAVVAAVWRWARERRDLLVPAWLVLGGTVAQGALGGVTVLTGLHPATVAGHFLLSMVLIAVSALLVDRQRRPGPRRWLVPRVVRALASLTTGVLAVVLVLGTVVTGSGPHSGDYDDPARFGLDPRTVSWLHADAVMLFTGLAVAMLVATSLLGEAGGRPRRLWSAVLLLTLGQGAVGYTQYLTGLPEALVLVHMAGAVALTLAVTLGMLALRAPAVAAVSPAAEAEGAAAGRSRPRGTAPSDS